MRFRGLKVRSDITEKTATPLQITIGVVLFRIIVRFIPNIVQNPQIRCMDDFFKVVLTCIFRTVCSIYYTNQMHSIKYV
jgi:hypothetical protein